MTRRKIHMPLFGEFSRSSQDLFETPYETSFPRDVCLNSLKSGGQHFKETLVADMMLWWHGDMMIRWYEDMMIWNGDMMIWWYGDLRIYDHMMKWRHDGMIVWWHDDRMIIWWWYDMKVWWYDGMIGWRYDSRKRPSIITAPSHKL